MLRLIVLFCLGGLLGGCIAPHSFVEPKYHVVGRQDIAPSATPVPVKLTVAAQTNGESNVRATRYWEQRIAQILRSTQVLEPTLNGYHAELDITVNNFGSKGEAATKGFVTGLTFGAVGSLVTDGYKISVKYTDRSAPARSFVHDYQHALYTTIGNASPPPGITGATLGEALGTISEDLVLQVLRDLQKEGALPVEAAATEKLAPSIK